MSFTAEVKDELARVEPTCSACDKAELSALVRIEGTLTISGGKPRLEIATETASVARTVIRLLHGVYDLKTELTVRRSVLHKTHNFLITVPAQIKLAGALEDLGVLSTSGFEQGVKHELVRNSCCAGAYLRGAFLAGGYIADPRGDFHFEMTVSSEELAQGMVELMTREGVPARAMKRHNTHSIYIKGADRIIAFLALTGAHRAALHMENARVVKSVRNDTNRRVNAEIANHAKSADAAMQQIAQIRALIERKGIESVPRSLQEVALLRLRHPDASIRELGELADPPLSKSAVAHRLRRINALAEGRNQYS